MGCWSSGKTPDLHNQFQQYLEVVSTDLQFINLYSCLSLARYLGVDFDPTPPVFSKTIVSCDLTFHVFLN